MFATQRTQPTTAILSRVDEESMLRVSWMKPGDVDDQCWQVSWRFRKSGRAQWEALIIRIRR